MCTSCAVLWIYVCAQIAVTHNGQIQYFPISTEQQIVSPEDLEAAAHSAVTGMTLSNFFYSFSK